MEYSKPKENENESNKKLTYLSSSKSKIIQ